MLTKEKNDLLTQVGPNTPMGNTLRCYWHPIAGVAELDKEPIKPMRLFGEDLVLYRDRSGNHGLIDRQCPHRRADMSYGFVDHDGIRCSYHGWKMNAEGRVINVPYDDIVNPDNKTKNACRSRAYPVRELAGMLWAYMGSGPAPELPCWEPLMRPQGFCEVVISEIPCNWLQCQENSIDPVHFEWLHDNWPAQLKGDLDKTSAKTLKVAFDDFEFGLIYRRIREGVKETDEIWTVGRVCLWPNGFLIGDHFEWRVPIDDENTLSISWFHTRVPIEQEPYVQDRIPTWYSPTTDERGRWINTHVINQDFIGWVGQGRIADRTKETLSLSDQGIAMMRRRFFEDIDKVAEGKDPSALVRDPERAKHVMLPIANAEFHEPMTKEQWLAHTFFGRRKNGNPWAAGQPPEVLRAFRDAMGLSGQA